MEEETQSVSAAHCVLLYRLVFIDRAKKVEPDTGVLCLYSKLSGNLLLHWAVKCDDFVRFQHLQLPLDCDRTSMALTFVTGCLTLTK